jgi:hypothetical protein
MAQFDLRAVRRDARKGGVGRAFGCCVGLGAGAG